MRIRERILSYALIGIAIIGFTDLLAGDPPKPPAPTPEVGAGPNHRAGAPFRAKLSPPGAVGTPLLVRGRVLDASDGSPVAGAVLDAWHADARGEYDRDGFEYRGRVLTDEEGRYEFETIRPAGYSSLPAHIHVIVTHEGHRTLRTEILFDRSERHPELVAEVVERSGRGEGYLEAVFEVVLRPD